MVAGATWSSGMSGLQVGHDLTLRRTNISAYFTQQKMLQPGHFVHFIARSQKMYSDLTFMFREANYGTKPCSWIKYILLYHRPQQLHGLNEFFEEYYQQIYRDNNVADIKCAGTSGGDRFSVTIQML